MKNDPYIVSAFITALERTKVNPDGTLPVVSMARQTGALGEEVAMRTAEMLTEMSNGKEPWLVVDKEVAERVIADHHLPHLISSFFSGEQKLSIDNYFDTLWGLSVPGAVMIKSLTKTMLELARIGNVVLVGRGAHVITAGFPRAVRVRIVGSFERRVARMAASLSCPESKAAAEVKEIDDRRRHFVLKYFHADLNDSSHYDLVLNTDRLSVDDCAHMIANVISNSHFGEKEALRHRELRHDVLGAV